MDKKMEMEWKPGFIIRYIILCLIPYIALKNGLYHCKRIAAPLCACGEEVIRGRRELDGR